MKNRILFVFLLFSIELSAQENLSPAEAKEDITFLYNKLCQIHPGLFRYQDSLSYEKLYSSLVINQKDSISYFDFFRTLSPLIYEVKDGHTSMTHAKEWTKSNAKKLPFILKEIEGEYLVQYNASFDSTFAKGLEVLELNGIPLSSILENLELNIGSDNGNVGPKKMYAVRSLYTYYPKFYELGDSVKVLVRNRKNDSLQTFKLASLKFEVMIKNIAIRYPNKIRKNLSYSMLDSTLSFAKMDISSFVMKGSKFDFFQMKFKRQLRRNFKEIQKDSVEHLLIDLRSNGGGYIPNVKRLMKYISKEPFSLMDTMAFRREAYFKIFPFYQILPPLLAPFYFNKSDDVYRYKAGTKKIKPKKNGVYEGELYVFMDAASYSASITTIALFKEMDRATFLGSSPGGIQWGNHAGSWYIAKLPNSKIRVRIPQYKIVHSRQIQNNEFTAVDYELKYKMVDFESGEDSFELALKRLLKRP